MTMKIRVCCIPSAGPPPAFSGLLTRWLRRVLAVLSALLIAMASTTAQAQVQQPAAGEPAAAQAERGRMAVERARIDADYAAAQQRCFQRFAVTDCRNESRRRRDAARTVLKKREIELNDAERARKATVQHDNIEQRRRERERREADAAAQATEAPAAERAAPARIAPGGAAAARGGAPNPPMAPRGKVRDDQRQRRATAAADRAERLAQEAAHVAQRERQLREAVEHKSDVLERSVAREKPAAPLPVPSSASTNRP